MRRMLLITLAVAVPVFLTTRLIFPLPDDGPQPHGIQVPLFIVVGVFEALALGLAVAVLVSVRQVIDTLPAAQRGPAWVVAIGTTWFLGNWWLHDNLHIQVGEHVPGLLALEYGFHVTMIVAGAAMIVALARLVRLLAQQRSDQDTARSGTPAR